MAYNLILFTAPVQAGKTTWLMHWAKDKPRLGGFLTPDVEGLRYLYTLRDRRLHPFQLTDSAAANMNPAEVISVGRFHFAAPAFELARQTLQEDSRRDCDWLLVDEIGRLELAGAGLEPAAGEAIRRYQRGEAQGRLLLVVREPLLEAVVEYYRLEGYTMIRLGEGLS